MKKKTCIIVILFILFICVSCNGHTCKMLTDIIIEESTCLKEGKMIKVCVECGEQFGEYQIIPPKEHSLSEWMLVKESTCCENGVEHQKCTQCNTVINERLLEKKEHVLGSEKIDINPTCTENGIKYKECLYCQEKVSEETISSFGHDYSDWIIEKESTCTEDGIKYKECKRCKEILEKEIINKGHNIEVIEGKAPGCLYTGLSEGQVCKECKEIILKQEVIEALGHDIVVDKAVESSCSNVGLTEGSHCTRCDEMTIKQEIVDKKEHIMVTDEMVESTCSKEGYTEGSHCLVCGEIGVKPQIIEKKPHDFNIETNRCNNCEEKEIWQEVKSIEEYNTGDFDKSKGLVIFFNQIDWTYDCTIFNIYEGFSYVRIIGDSNRTYSAVINWNASCDVVLDLVNVNLEPTNDRYSPIMIISEKNVTIGLYGSSCNIKAAKAGLPSGIHFSTQNGEDGMIGIDATNSNLTINFATTKVSKIVGGSGGDGDESTTIGGDGGNGNYAIKASSITVTSLNGCDYNNLYLVGGSGGKGGDRVLDGNPGKDSPGTNVTILYK